MRCHECTVYGRYDTAGRPVYGWRCYCGTTACLQQRNISQLAEIETVVQKKLDELTPAKEDAFYKKVFKTELPTPKEH